MAKKLKELARDGGRRRW